MKRLILILCIAVLAFCDCKNRLFTYSNGIDSKERLSIEEFLNLLVTQQCGVNIVYKDKKVSEILSKKMPFVRIKNYTLKKILNLILCERGLFYSLENDILKISYYKTKTYKLDFISDNRIGESNLDTIESKIKNEYKFDFWDKVSNNINTILKNISNDFKPPVIDKTVGLITVTGTKKQIEAIDEYIDMMLKRLTKEVLIDVKIYTVELSSSHKTGIDWSKFSINLNKTDTPLKGAYIIGSKSVFSEATFDIEGFLNFLARNGNVNSLSNPKILTLNNQKAIISVGDTVYYKYASKITTDKNGNPNTEYTIDSKFVGIVLDITPQISDSNDIILSISPKISAFKDATQLADSSRDMPPDTKDNTMLSIVRLKNNQTLIFGGIIENDEAFEINGIPILKEIPLIKYLFSSKEKITSSKELVFVITPHVVNFNTN